MKIDKELYNLIMNDEIDDIYISQIDSSLVIRVDAFDNMQQYRYNLYQFMVKCREILREKYNIYSLIKYEKDVVIITFRHNCQDILTSESENELESFINGLNKLVDRHYIERKN